MNWCASDGRGATFEVTPQANDRFLGWVTERLGSSVFYSGSCAGSHSYYFNQHGEAASVAADSSTVNAFREAGSFPVEDYTYA